PFIFYPLAKIVQAFDWKDGSVIIQLVSFLVTLIFIGIVCPTKEIVSKKFTVSITSLVISMWWVTFFLWTWYNYHGIFIHG
ncbi:MAG: hypothetical protein WCK03_04300, partial [Candidatus Taylorbacteria bacterium]